MVLLALVFCLVNQFRALADSTVMIIVKSLCLCVQVLDLNTNDASRGFYVYSSCDSNLVFSFSPTLLRNETLSGSINFE